MSDESSSSPSCIYIFQHRTRIGNPSFGCRGGPSPFVTAAVREDESGVLNCLESAISKLDAINSYTLGPLNATY